MSLGPSLYRPRSRSSLRSGLSSPRHSCSELEVVEINLPDTTLLTTDSKSLLTAVIPPVQFDLVVSQYLSVSEICKLRSVCKSWRSAVDNRWVRLCVGRCGVSAKERPFFWLFYCANIPALVKSERIRLHGILNNAECPETMSDIYAFWRAYEISRERKAEISRDVSRTMPNHPFFADDTLGKCELQDVLEAIVACESSVGYCQGMNFIAAVLLIHTRSAQDAFWMLLAMLRHYHFRFLFAPAVPLLPLRMYQFSHLVRRELPAVWHHLNSQGFSLDVIAHQWVMTLFGYYIEPGFLANIWDLFFLTGWKAVFKTGLTLLKSMESSLLALDMERISEFLQLSKRDDKQMVEGTVSAMWRIANEYKVSNKELVSLARQYQTEQLLAAVAEIGEGRINQNIDTVHSGRGWRRDGYCPVNDNEAEKESIIRLTIPGFTVDTSTDDSFLCVDLASLTTFNTPLEGVLNSSHNRLKIKSLLQEPLSEFIGTTSSILRLPFRVIADMMSNVKFADEVVGKDVSQLTVKILSLEKKLLVLQKDRDAKIAQYEETARDFAEISERKRLTANLLQGLVTSGQPIPEESPKPNRFKAASVLSFKFPVLAAIRERTKSLTGDKSPKRRSSSDEVSVVLKSMVDIEKLYHDSRLVLETERQVLRNVDSEFNELNDVKMLYITQLVDFTAAMEKRRHDIVWRYLISAAQVFSKERSI